MAARIIVLLYILLPLLVLSTYGYNLRARGVVGYLLVMALALIILEQVTPYNYSMLIGHLLSSNKADKSEIKIFQTSNFLGELNHTYIS